MWARDKILEENGWAKIFEGEQQILRNRIGERDLATSASWYKMGWGEGLIDVFKRIWLFHGVRENIMIYSGFFNEFGSTKIAMVKFWTNGLAKAADVLTISIQKLIFYIEMNFQEIYI